ncbi:FtsW/RodA/SpoVE family cell cycle protein [Paucilactobacillus sp. N302-9]
MLKKKRILFDYYLFVPYLILCLIGIVMVYSSSADIASQNGGSPTAYLIKQAVYVVVGFVVLVFVRSINIKILQSPKILLIFAIGLLGSLVFVRLFGQAVNGARGWINLGFMSIQPAEVCKIFLVLYLARMLSQNENRIQQSFVSSVMGPLLIAGSMILLILIQPDLGGAVINAAIVAIMLLASGISWRKGVSIVFGGIAAFIFVVLPVLTKMAQNSSIKSYKLQRIIAFVNPFGTARGAGSQLVNSYYAISNGGIFGRGLGNSIQKMGYLPEPNTDFILAVISEELGLVAILIILTLLTIIIARTIWLGVRADDAYSSLICYGVATFITVETLFNVGGVVGLLPITGVTFPFISYGGSSMLVLCAALGCVLNISKQEQKQARLQPVES